MEVIKIKGWNQLQEDFTGIVECNGKHWYKEGFANRVDGPAEEWSCGDKSWYINGKCISEKEHFKQTVIMKTTLGKLIYG